MIGQDAVTTAQAFLDGVGYDGVVLTKLDGDARGGAALSIAQLTGRPVMFASSGEKLEDFDLFHPDRMASRILDLGDILTLIEQAERTFDQDQAAAMAGKLASGEGFTLEDFVEQLAMVRKLGPIGNLLGMLPGAAQNREMLSQVSDKDLDRAAAIVNSMTPAGAPQPEDHQRLAPGADRGRLRRHRGRGQQPDRPVPRGPEDDAPDDGRRRHARDAGMRRGGPEGPRRRRRRARAARPAARRPAAAGPPAWRRQRRRADGAIRRALAARRGPGGCPAGCLAGSLAGCPARPARRDRTFRLPGWPCRAVRPAPPPNLPPGLRGPVRTAAGGREKGR